MCTKILQRSFQSIVKTCHSWLTWRCAFRRQWYEWYLKWDDRLTLHSGCKASIWIPGKNRRQVGHKKDKKLPNRKYQKAIWWVYRIIGKRKDGFQISIKESYILQN